MTRCPKCGFDYDPSRACPACGHGATAEAPQAAPSGRKGEGGLLSLAAGTLFCSVLLAGGLFCYLTSPPPAAPAAAAQSPALPTTSEPPAPISAIAGGQTGRPTGESRAIESGPKAAISLQARALESMPIDSLKSYLAWMKLHSNEDESFLRKKWDRSRAILARKDVTNDTILRAFLYTPREYFARSYNQKKAYDDTAIPIGHGQTISGPHMVSHMTESIEPGPDERILEIGTGSGYQSALLSELSNQVYTIEIVSPLFAETDTIYRKLEGSYPEYRNITRMNGDGYFGWPEHAPFEKIIVTAGIDHIPPPLLKQLAPGGIMVIPVGPPSGQTVLKVVKKVLPDGSFAFERSDIYHGRKVIFVPFTSSGGGVHKLNDGKGQ